MSNEFGCEAITSQKIKVLEQRPIYIPTAFSPNDDGQNDFFEIHIGPSIKSVNSLSIFNRWGQLVYQTKNSAQNQPLNWNGTFKGKSVDAGIYVYYAEIEMESGTVEIYKGDFFIIK